MTDTTDTPLTVRTDEAKDLEELVKNTGLSPHSVRVVRSGSIKHARDSIRIQRARRSKVKFAFQKEEESTLDSTGSAAGKEDDTFLPSPTLMKKVRQLSKVTSSQDSVDLRKKASSIRTLKASKIFAKRDSIAIAKKRLATDSSSEDDSTRPLVGGAAVKD
eukprot:g115.t1